jgi:hypothetical protein
MVAGIDGDTDDGADDPVMGQRPGPGRVDAKDRRIDRGHRLGPGAQ